MEMTLRANQIQKIHINIQFRYFHLLSKKEKVKDDHIYPFNLHGYGSGATQFLAL
jgi:hypothetical protein